MGPSTEMNGMQSESSTEEITSFDSFVVLYLKKKIAAIIVYSSFFYFHIYIRVAMAHTSKLQ